MSLKFVYQDFLGDRRFKNTTKQNDSKPNTANVDDNAWYYVKVAILLKGQRLLLKL
ncbi:hypothetical protein RGU12_05250 [Fredinandcohnia sp. QZ13]|uniref:hypothetical protein n=1 Tax=Fredinandcohnia sp. QZ13 TaxID=3073144 RepID=UPI00285350ED|nr:hypothetical protein [Fredinandcohnia sp. QZ13]MDR4886962.1 hypothetical protein [Fredinandcohnia sp. QZ13]